MIAKLVYGMTRALTTVASWNAIVLSKVKTFPLYYKPERRFLHSEPDFPQATAMVDGVPVSCRASAEYFNPKHGCKSIVFQVMSDLRGLPIAWNAGEAGSTHDATSFDAWQNILPWHHCDEYFLADKAYVANSHCLTPTKLQRTADSQEERNQTEPVIESSQGDEVNHTTRTGQEMLFDAHHRKYRVRIEHLFAHLSNRHRWISTARESLEVVPIYFSLLMHIEARYMEDYVGNSRYFVPLSPPEWSRYVAPHALDETGCVCGFVRSTAAKQKITEVRNRLTQQFNARGIFPICLASQKSQKGKDKTYTSRAAIDQRGCHKEKRDSLTKKKKKNVRDRIDEKKRGVARGKRVAREDDSP